MSEKHYVDLDNAEDLFSGIRTALDDKQDELDLRSILATGNPLSFITDSAQVAQNTVITFEPIQAGSGDPSPSNVREIEGYVKAELKGCGKNLLNINANTSAPSDVTAAATTKRKFQNNTFIVGLTANNYYTESSASFSVSNNVLTAVSQGGYGVGYAIRLLAGQTYKVSYSNSSNGLIVIAYYASDGTYISSDYSEVFTVPNNADTTIILFRSTSAGTCTFTNVQLELGSTATTYEPYNPLTDISEQLPTTLYGFKLNVESGELVVDRKLVTVDGDETMTFTGYSIAVVLNTSDIDTNKLNQIILNDGVYGDTKSVIYTGLEYDWEFYTIPYSCFSAEAFREYVQSSPIQIVYSLATPITYHLTPHQVRLLLGSNTVTTNGTSISLTYRKGEIAKLSDLNGIAESVEGLGEIVKDNAIKRVTFSDTTNANGVIPLYSRGFTKDNIVNAFALTTGNVTSMSQIYVNNNGDSFMYLKVTDTNMSPAANVNVEVTVLYV